MDKKETFEEYQARLRKLEIRAEMHRDGFFRAKPAKSSCEVLY